MQQLANIRSELGIPKEYDELPHNALVLLPTNGLGNRLRVLVQGLRWSEAQNKPLYIAWPQETALRCSFHEIFQDDRRFKILNPPSLPLRFFPAKIKKKLLAFVPGNLHKNSLLNTFLDRVWLKLLIRHTYPFDMIVVQSYRKGSAAAEEIPDTAVAAMGSGRDSKVLVCANGLALPKLHPHELARLYQRLRLIPDLQRRVDQSVQQFQGCRVVGVHIRRGDLNKKTRRHSPTQAFVRRMREELAEYPETRFFLASDSQKEINRLKILFGDRLLTQPIAAQDRESRTTVAGVKAATVDLYILSHTARIVGSYGSSYAYEAANMGNLVLDIINTKEKQR